MLRPRVNLTRYHGVFAPNSKLRAKLVPGKPRKKRNQKPDTSNQPVRPDHQKPSDPPRLTWAQRLKRVFEFDVTVCPLCGGTLRVIEDITDPIIIDKILSHIRQSRAPPAQAALHRTSKSPIRADANLPMIRPDQFQKCFRQMDTFISTQKPR